MIDWGHWKTNLADIPMGFIYCITNKINGRKYIGKKQCQTIIKKKVAGRKNKIHQQKETDWRKYTGSCKELNEDIKRLGKENFEFEIIYPCRNKWELSYHETRLQFENKVLLTANYYNKFIGCRLKGLI